MSLTPDSVMAAIQIVAEAEKKLGMDKKLEDLTDLDGEIARAIKADMKEQTKVSESA